MKFAHVTLSVNSLEESIKFYNEIVGLPIAQRFQAGPDCEIAFLGDGETLVELIENKNTKDIDVGNSISIGFEVDSLDKTLDFVKEKGIEIESGPIQPNPSTRFFFVLDPNGIKVQFIEQ